MTDCRKCGAPTRKHPQVCDDCRSLRIFLTDYVSGALSAAREVAKARRAGVLASPRLFACIDCNRPATEYDHRDYNAPLIVAPVCRGCNARRGRAIPKRWTASEWLAYVMPPTKKRSAAFRLWQRFQHKCPELSA